MIHSYFFLSQRKKWNWTKKMVLLFKLPSICFTTNLCRQFTRSISTGTHWKELQADCQSCSNGSATSEVPAELYSSSVFYTSFMVQGLCLSCHTDSATVSHLYITGQHPYQVETVHSSWVSWESTDPLFSPTQHQLLVTAVMRRRAAWQAFWYYSHRHVPCRFSLGKTQKYSHGYPIAGAMMHE